MPLRGMQTYQKHLLQQCLQQMFLNLLRNKIRKKTHYDRRLQFQVHPGYILLLFTLLLSGCIAENTDDCYTGIPLTVELPADISPQAMKDISLYVFDDKDRLLDVFAISGQEP